MRLVICALRIARWPFALAVAFVACVETACVPSPPASAPEADSGDGGGSFCQHDCATRAKAQCLEPMFAATCVATCDRARAAGLWEPCNACSHYVGGDGADHVRCTR